MNKQKELKISMEEKLSTECLRIDRCQMSMHILCEQLWQSGRKGIYIIKEHPLHIKTHEYHGVIRVWITCPGVVCAVWTSACMVSYKINGAPPLTCGWCAKSNQPHVAFLEDKQWSLMSTLMSPTMKLATAQWSGHSNFPVNAALLLEKEMMLMDQTDGLLSTVIRQMNISHWIYDSLLKIIKQKISRLLLTSTSYIRKYVQI